MMKSTMRTIFSMLGLGVILSFALASCAPKTLSFDEMRLKYKDRITGGENLDLDDPIVKKRLESADQGVREMWNSMNKAEDRTYLWNDKGCQDDTLSPFRPTSVTTPIGRLSGMATAYATKGSEFYQNQELKKDIIEGMEWMYANKWSPNHPLYGNWWDWIIGMPYSVNNMLVVMYDDFTPEQRAKYIEALDFYAPGVTYEGAATGANKIWQCFSMALRGILSHNPDKIKMGVDGMDTEFKYVTVGDGFYDDGSYVQHEWHSYTGGYGAGFLRDIASMIDLVHGSEWAVGQDKIDMTYGWIENSYLPLIYKGAMMDLSRGREIAREAASDRSTGHGILLSSYLMSRTASPEVKNRIQSIVKFHIVEDKARNFVENVPTYLLGEMRAFIADEKIQPVDPAPYHKQFSMMDRVVHVRPTFALGLAMSSSRIENYESIDTENMKAWHIGDGTTYLYNGDQKQFTDNFWSTVDYYRIPGTTVAVQEHEVKSIPFGSGNSGVLYADGYKSPHSWVGGSSILNAYGMAGMWFADEKSSLGAKKSWFMVGDEIVCLGAAISCNDPYTIETIVDQRKLSEGNYRITLDEKSVLENNGTVNATAASWAQLEGDTPNTALGYYFPGGANVNLMRETRTGSWSDFSKYGRTDVETRNYFVLWFDHGKKILDKTYAYVLLPGKSAAEMKAYAAAPTVTVLENTAAIQSVKQSTEGVTGINFWNAPAKSVAGVSTDAPASVVMQQKEGTLVIGISDPTQLQKNPIILEIDQAAAEVVTKDASIEVLSTTPTIKISVNVTGENAFGKTHNITLKL